MVLYMLLYCKWYGLVDCTVWYMELYGTRYGVVIRTAYRFVYVTVL